MKISGCEEAHKSDAEEQPEPGETGELFGYDETVVVVKEKEKENEDES